jgi:peptidyl-prolyl cis-trans isomerase D
VDKLVERQRQQILAQLGPNADPRLIDVKRMRKDAVERLVNQELLVQQAGENGYLVSEASVMKEVNEYPAFQENGKFSRKLFEDLLRQNGETPRSFLDTTKKRISQSLLTDGFAQSGIATMPELERLSALNFQKRDIHYATVPAARFLANITVSDDEVRKFYEANSGRFALPETVTLEYFTLSRSDFLEAAKPSEEDLRTLYDEKVRLASADEQRQAQHILITVDGKTKDADALKKIREVEKRLRAGEDFGKLAREFSQDPGSVANGGNLDMTSRGTFVPEFDKVLFSLKQGEVSEPVKTQYGYHIIKLNKIEKAETPSFAELRSELEKQAREAKAEELFAEAAEKLDAAVYEASDLQEPASKYKRVIAETQPFSRNGGTGIASDRKVVEAAFSEDLIKEGRNSQGIYLPDGSLAWMRVKKHAPASRRPLAEVAAEVRNQLLIDKAGEKARAVAASVSKALNAGATLADVAARESLSWQSLPDATRRSQVPMPDILRVAYRLPHPAQGKISADSFGLGSSFVVVAVTKVVPGEPVPAAELAQVRNAMSEKRSEEEFSDYIHFLRERGDVEISAVPDEAKAED